ncbi:hypothetical protein EC960109_2391A, partial [Escherichia coli 96.0109]|jgi:hypothetical protein
MKIIIL